MAPTSSKRLANAQPWVKTALDVFENFSALVPVPGVQPAVQAISAMCALLQNVNDQVEEAQRLKDRCVDILIVFKDPGLSEPGREDRLSYYVERLVESICRIINGIASWLERSRKQRLLNQGTIGDDFKAWNLELDHMHQLINSAICSSIHEHVSRLTAGSYTERMMDAVMNPDLTDLPMKDYEPIFIEAMQATDGYVREQISVNYVHNLQVQMRLPQDPNLQGRYKVLGQGVEAFRGIYEIQHGKLYNVMDVTLRTINVRDTPREDVQRRFIRQYKIWKELFVKDKGTHILPVLGWVEKGHNTQKDPVIITPRSKHYNAFLYVKETETQYALMGDSSPIDYISLILMVARGLRVLHTMDPPIYHGDVRGENIEIAPCGRPLLANFWFSKYSETNGAAQRTQTGDDDWQRFAPPEVHTQIKLTGGYGESTGPSDVWSFAMTVLQFITGEVPFPEFRNGGFIPHKLMENIRPTRPTGPEAERKGMSDKLWKLLQRCWHADPAQRPTIQQVISKLKHIKAARGAPRELSPAVA